MEPNLKVENPGKSYIIGHQRESYTALRDVFTNKAKQTVSNAEKFFRAGNSLPEQRWKNSETRKTNSEEANSNSIEKNSYF